MSDASEEHIAVNPVGFVQGKLTVAADADWQNEFFLASRHGLDGIELVFEGDIKAHPLMTDSGLDMIRKISVETRVRVLSIYASYFRQFPLHKANSDTDSILPVLKRLIHGCRKIGASQLLLPCDGESGIASDSEARELKRALGSCMADAITCGVNLALMLDLSTDKLLAFVRDFDSPAVMLAFDTASRAVVDPVKEINIYGQYISSVHVRDRLSGGTPSPLGDGNVDLYQICRKLREQRYGGPFILTGEMISDSDSLASDLAYMRALLV